MKLKTIANISTGYSFRSKIKHDPSGRTKVIQMSDVDKDQGVVITNKLLSVKNFNPRSKRYFLDAGDIIMISKGYSFKAFVVPEGLGRVVAVNSFMVMKLQKDKVLSGYLEWFLNSKRIQHFFTEMAAGTHVPNLSLKAMEDLDINPPSMNKQHQIASLNSLKRKEIFLHHKIAAKRKMLVDEVLQKQADKWSNYKKGE